MTKDQIKLKPEIYAFILAQRSSVHDEIKPTEYIDRVCLRCDRKFTAVGKQYYICDFCKESKDWRDGE